MELFDLVHSVDSLRLAESLAGYAVAVGKRLDVLIQVDVSGEATKHGVAPDAVAALVRQVVALPGLRVQGLMTIGPNTADPAAVRAAFRQVRATFEACAGLPLGEGAMRHLSMGMSGDFPLAIAEGATMLRLGTAIFGPRPEGAGADPGAGERR